MLLERFAIRYWMNFDLFHTDDIRVEHCDGTRRGVQQVLDACREERRPYLITTPHSQCGVPENARGVLGCSITSSTPPLEGEVGRGLTSILVPITMLEEEVYKAEICTYLARKTGAHLILLRANDYGSKAKRNTQRIITHIQIIAERTGERITYEERVAKGDSFHIHKELHQLPIANNQYPSLILLTASREYGLDDWLFGPPEQYVIRHSPVPVMLVNPRADLFSLCD